MSTTSSGTQQVVIGRCELLHRYLGSRCQTTNERISGPAEISRFRFGNIADNPKYQPGNPST